MGVSWRWEAGLGLYPAPQLFPKGHKSGRGPAVAAFNRVLLCSRLRDRRLPELLWLPGLPRPGPQQLLGGGPSQPTAHPPRALLPHGEGVPWGAVGLGVGAAAVLAYAVLSPQSIAVQLPTERLPYASGFSSPVDR